MRRRTVPAVSAAVLLLAGVTGCSASGSAANDCDASFGPGAMSSSVEVTGGAGEGPRVQVPEGLTAEQSQRSLITDDGADGDRGDARVADDDTLVAVNLALFESGTGSELLSSPTWDADRGASFVLMDPEMENPLAESLRCAVAGDRVVAAFNPEDSALLAGQGTIAEGESIVGVIDVVTVDDLVASGKTRNLPSGFPAVVTDESGRPGVVLPPRPAPDGSRSADRIVGDGPEVEADDAVIAQVLAVGWNGTVDPQNNSWDTMAGQGGPKPIGTEDDIAASGATYRAELTGHTVGSQVVIVEGGENARVVVVDIVSVG
ncbi:peptidylprolyl isomerase [Leucobacter tardus]|uniref:Peptidylprolyl isomerase n=1 Tax=Leucobacter tardus TaxID=501483 RepID=A0A939TMZ1_9MICO|nr:peptidylprolyl isomerase [Leucobacter tardus]